MEKTRKNRGSIIILIILIIFIGEYVKLFISVRLWQETAITHMNIVYSYRNKHHPVNETEITLLLKASNQELKNILNYKKGINCILAPLYFILSIFLIWSLKPDLKLFKEWLLQKGRNVID